MYLRLLIYLFLFVFQTQTASAQASEEALEQAEMELKAAEKKYSKEHLGYATAALKLAALRYMNSYTTNQGDSVAIPALQFIRTKYSPQSPEYQDALMQIPFAFSSILDAEFNLEESFQLYGANHPIYAEKLLQLSIAFLNNNQKKGYEICLNAFRILERFPAAEVKNIYEFAFQQVDAVVLSLVTHQLDLEKTEEQAPQSLIHADKLLHFARLSMDYLHDEKAATRLDSSYSYIKYALNIYEKKLGVKDKKYKEAFKIFTPKMQEMYPLEKSIFEYLAQHETANDSFLFDLRPFLYKVDSADFLTYKAKDIFRIVLQDLADYQGGEENKYYRIVQAIRSSWDLNDNQYALENQIAQTYITRTTYGENSLEYIVELIKQANLQTEEADKEQAMLWYIEAFEILEKIDFTGDLFKTYLQFVKKPWDIFVINEHNLPIKAIAYSINPDDYLRTLLQTAWDYTQNNQLKPRAERYYRTALKSTNGQNRQIIIEALHALLEQDALAGIKIISPILPHKAHLLDVENLLKTPIENLRQKYGESSLEYALALELLADSYYLLQERKDLTEASFSLYQRVLSIYKFHEGPRFNYLRLLKKIVRQIEEKTNWSVKDGIVFFEILIAELECQKVDKKLLVAYVFRFANWHYDNNRIVESEAIYRRYIAMFSKAETSPSYLQSLYNLGRINRKTGRYQTAKNYYEQVLQISRSIPNNILTINCLDDFGLLAQLDKNYDQALHFFQLSMKTLEEFEKASPNKNRFRNKDIAELYAKILRHIGRLHFDKNDLDNAQKYYDQVLDFELKNDSLVSFGNDIALYRDFALLYEQLEDAAQAMLYYKLAIDNLTDKDELADVNISFGNYHHLQEQDSLAAIYFKNALKIDLEQIETNYINLSEQERFLFLASMANRFNSFWDFVSQYNDKQILKTALDAHLIIKGLSLETTANIQSLCHNTENTALIRDCNELQNLRNDFSKSTALSLERQAEINRQIVDLEKRIALYSKNLSDSSNTQNSPLNFKDLQKILRSSQHKDSLAIAIDFLVIEQLDEQEEMQSVYYALVVNTLDSFPNLVRLATEAELQDVLSPDIAPNTVNYITNSSESYYLYQLVWEPLLPFIQPAKKIHLCPTGILSRIAFGTLLGSNYKPQRIMDLWSIHYYSSLRDLLQKQKNQNFQEGERIALVGGVKFTFTKEDLYELAEELGVQEFITQEIINNSERDPSNNSSSSSNRGEDFNDLPGTLQEIKNIAALFIKNNADSAAIKEISTPTLVDYLQNTYATEERFIQLFDNPPSILHIATHGFFFPTPKEDLTKKKSSNNINFETKIANLNNPLLRSGLALAGINRVWKGGQEIEGLEDGILTALEVSNLDLFNTKLVVLSACETGRGDIDNNEGILGLRRAFKTAGAQQLIISLWKVPDEQTSELMQIFYANYINGMPIHTAFEQAQHSMRLRYKNPYYWAAFLLIE